MNVYIKSSFQFYKILYMFTTQPDNSAKSRSRLPTW